MTWKTEAQNNENLSLRLQEALSYAKFHGVDTVLFTGSGEPTLCWDLPAMAVEASTMPIRELQTNGYKLSQQLRNDWIENFTHISISAASTDPARSAEIMGLPRDYNYLELAKTLSQLGFVVRIQLNLNKIGNPPTFAVEAFVDVFTRLLRKKGVHQLSLHQIQTPYGKPKKSSGEYVKWIEEHAWSAKQCHKIWRAVADLGVHLRTLSFGAKVYDVNSVSVAVTHCMDMEGRDESQIRSLILQPDGHLYHHWNYRGSILL
jgi:hypothetical protein